MRPNGATTLALEGVVEHGSERPAIPPFARWPVLLVALLVAAVHAVVGSRPRAWYDESLQLAIGRHHLDWGSVDQPPLTPLLARLADTVAPGSPLALAAPAILATATGVVLSASIAREMGGDRWAQTLAALAQATGVWAANVGHWLTPYSLEPVLWLAVFWLLARWVRRRDDVLLVVLGAVIGVAAQTKFQTMLLAVVLVVSIAAVGPRALLARRWLWVGAALALAIAAPTLLWQAANGWPQLKMSPLVAEQMLQAVGRWGVARSLVTNAGWLGVALGVVGFVALLVSPRMRDHRFIAVAVAVLYVLYVLPPGRGTYLAGAYGVLAAAGAVALQHRAESARPRGQRRRWELLVACPLVAMSLWTAAAAVRQSIAQASPVAAAVVADTTARALAALPAGQRERTGVMADTFMYSAYLDTAAPELGLPPVASGSVSYGYFPPPEDTIDSVLLVTLGDSPNQQAFRALRPWFNEARPVARAMPRAGRLALGSAAPTTVWLLTGRTAPWTVIQPAIRTVR